ncbi:unnamed protein product [Protopolystoma xenopodis]|uniref:Uncharacterized protein n=1 Tax=Protopolystoma xenopodis TaxID=117903 RepID=A0A448XN80_9PLAT|nr:unnamed protein product [Protopolystoma xenopodis]
MLLAHGLGFTTGEYAFFNIDLFSEYVTFLNLHQTPLIIQQQLSRPWYRMDAPEEENLRAREAYRALMTVTIRKPKSRAYQEFTEEVKRRALHDYGYDYSREEV